MLFKGSQNLEIRSLIIQTQGGSTLYVCNKFEVDSSISSKVIRGPKISKLGHVTLSHAPFEP